MEANSGQSDYRFAYNADGIRTSKTIGGQEHRYLLNGSQIVAEEFGIYCLVYLYDENGAPIGMQYRTQSMAVGEFQDYFFERNLQGDIVAIYNAAGKKIGTYTYDAWGNFTFSTASDATTVEKRIVRTYNPFRYRGYYYDTDTGLYYLQSRYYNPQWGRFLNADGYVSTGTGLLGYNMYAYCSNNPVMYVDPTGDFPWLFALVALVLTVALAPSLTSCTEGVESTIVKEEEFETPLDAVMDFGTTYNPQSTKNNEEYGTVIYEVIKDGKTYYTYTTVNIGGQNGVKIPHAPKGYNEVAMIHTHGREMDEYRSEVHSYEDKSNAIARDLDKV